MPQLISASHNTCLTDHEHFLFLFVSAIWLPHGQLWTIIEGTATLTQC